MATKQEKQQLIDTLRFTPVTVQLSIQGYGGESYAGTVDRKIYDLFKQHRIDMDEYASDWDDRFVSLVPDNMQPYTPGSAYDCDNLWHASGAELTSLNLIIVTEIDSNATVWEHNLDHGDLETVGVDVTESSGTELADLKEGTVVHWGGQGEKGCFFDAEFVLRAPFDASKLRISYENCDGWYLVTGVEYDGEELDGYGGYSTTGKWAENKWIIVGDEEVYEPTSIDDMDLDENIDIDPNQGLPSEEWDPVEELDKILVEFDDLDKTDWFPGSVAPMHKGTYEVQMAPPGAWPFPSEAMYKWTGKNWKDVDGKTVKRIAQWRGLKEPV